MSEIIGDIESETPETTEKEAEQPESEHDEQGLQDAFSLGFEGVSSGQGGPRLPGEKDKPADHIAESASPDERDDEGTAKPSEAEDGPATFTRAEQVRLLRAADASEALSKLELKGRLDSLLGHMGNMFQRFDKLAADVQHGESAYVAKEDLMSLKDQYSEIADPVVEAFDERQALRTAEMEKQKFQTDATAEAAVSNDALIEEATFRAAEEHLVSKYPQWETSVWEPGFREWMAAQDDSKAIEETTKPLELVAALDRFNADAKGEARHKGERPSQQPQEGLRIVREDKGETETPREKKTARRRLQLERAVTPKGDRSAAGTLKSDEDIFMEGFLRRKGGVGR